MRIVNDENKIQKYIEKFEIDSFFEEDMSPYMKLYYFDKGENILTAGEQITTFYFIVEGKAKIFNLLENGKSLLLRFAKPLSDLGSVELLNEDKIIKSNVQALHEVIIIGIDFEVLKKHAEDDVKFLKYIVRSLSFKLFTISNASAINLSYPFENRFASYILSVYSDFMVDNKPERVGEIMTTNLTELATLLGVSYRHLNRVIKEFEAKGLIKKTKKGFIILDFDKLEELSGGIYE